MDSSKAKQAKSKAKARTKSTATEQSQAEAQRQLLALHAAMQAQNITPEVQAQQVAMQNQTQTVNPYHMMGAMQPNLYNPGNVVHGGLVPGSY